MHKSGLPSSYPVVEDAAAGVSDVIRPAADVLVVVHLQLGQEHYQLVLVIHLRDKRTSDLPVECTIHCITHQN